MGLHYWAMDPRQILKVAVLVDHRPNHPGEVGGLAGTWEQISRVAAGRRDLDLTVCFLGDSRRTITVHDNVRYVLLPPLLGTERLPFLRGIPTNTDLSPFHPQLYWRLNGFHVIHTTDAFHAFAKTAWRRCRRTGTPLVNSVQTDIIGWARVYTPRILRRLLPEQVVTRWLLGRLRYLDRQERSMERRFGRYLAGCRAVFVSHDRDRERAARLAPRTKVRPLRRGIDLDLFHPRRRDRGLLESRWGVPADLPLLLFVGRIDPVKGAVLAARLAGHLIEGGVNTHLLVVGDGSQKEEVMAILGHRVTLTGNLPHEELGWIYASADLLLFPSEAEVWPNVVMEAQASGLAVMACARGAGHVMGGAGEDGILLSGRDEAEWRRAATDLVARPEALRRMGAEAHRRARARAATWTQVLEEDLLPVWREVCGGGASGPSP